MPNDVLLKLIAAIDKLSVNISRLASIFLVARTLYPTDPEQPPIDLMRDDAAIPPPRAMPEEAGPSTIPEEAEYDLMQDLLKTPSGRLGVEEGEESEQLSPTLPSCSPVHHSPDDDTHGMQTQKEKESPPDRSRSPRPKFHRLRNFNVSPQHSRSKSQTRDFPEQEVQPEP